MTYHEPAYLYEKRPPEIEIERCYKCGEYLFKMPFGPDVWHAINEEQVMCFKCIAELKQYITNRKGR